MLVPFLSPSPTNGRYFQGSALPRLPSSFDKGILPLASKLPVVWTLLAELLSGSYPHISEHLLGILPP